MRVAIVALAILSLEPAVINEPKPWLGQIDVRVVARSCTIPVVRTDINDCSRIILGTHISVRKGIPGGQSNLVGFVSE